MLGRKSFENLMKNDLDSWPPLDEDTKKVLVARAHDLLNIFIPKIENSQLLKVPLEDLDYQFNKLKFIKDWFITERIGAYFERHPLYRDSKQSHVHLVIELPDNQENVAEDSPLGKVLKAKAYADKVFCGKMDKLLGDLLVEITRSPLDKTWTIIIEHERYYEDWPCVQNWFIKKGFVNVNIDFSREKCTYHGLPLYISLPDTPVEKDKDDPLSRAFQAKAEGLNIYRREALDIIETLIEDVTEHPREKYWPLHLISHFFHGGLRRVEYIIEQIQKEGIIKEGYDKSDSLLYLSLPNELGERSKDSLLAKALEARDPRILLEQTAVVQPPDILPIYDFVSRSKKDEYILPNSVATVPFAPTMLPSYENHQVTNCSSSPQTINKKVVIDVRP